MAKAITRKRSRRGHLSVRKVLEQFDEVERSSAHRKGTFKIDMPFEDALQTVLKAKPDRKAKYKR